MFTATDNPSIFAVSGLSTDPNFVRTVGDAIHLEGSTKPASLKYVHFSDGVVKAVIRGYGESKGGYILREPRGVNAPRKAGIAGKHVDPQAAMAAIDAEARAKKAAVVKGLEAKLGKLAAKFDEDKAALESAYNAACSELTNQIKALTVELGLETAIDTAFEGVNQDEAAAA